MPAKDENGKLKQDVNDKIEWAFYNWGKLSNGFLTTDGQMGHLDFDALILRTLLVDGEVFIRIHKEVKNPYGLTFELIDAASVEEPAPVEAEPVAEVEIPAEEAAPQEAQPEE